jgi:hypothetical protein
MLYKKCPNCSAKLKFRECIGLLHKGYDVCKYCQKPFQIRRRSVYRNGAILGTMIGIMARSMSSWNILEIMVFAGFVSYLFLRFLDFFYELESADVDVLL